MRGAAEQYAAAMAAESVDMPVSWVDLTAELDNLMKQMGMKRGQVARVLRRVKKTPHKHFHMHVPRQLHA